MIKHLGWMGFKVMEIFLGLFCLAYHFKGFLYVERASEFLMYLAVFVLFPLANMMTSINICFGHPPSMASETLMCMLATVSYILAAIFTMYSAEKDFYMMYLANTEGDTIYPFFFYSKAQSISSLVTGVLYLLHCFLLIDAMCYDVHVYAEGDADVVGKPLEVYCFNREVHMMINMIDGYKPPRPRRYTEDMETEDERA